MMNNYLQQIIKSGNPLQAIMSNLTPQQKQIAQAFLNNPNRDQALEDLKKQYNVSDAQIQQLTNVINSNKS